MKEKRILLIYPLILVGISIALSTGCSNNNDLSTAVKDPDGNVYHTVTIGTQVWMVENLKTTKYSDGTSIPYVTDITAWSTLTTPAYSWYSNDPSANKASYGALYNWYAVNTGKLAPTGWHVPSDAEWTTLITYLGGANVAGGKLKEAGTAHWSSSGGTNDFGFTALPGGSRYSNGSFYIMGTYGFWWSSTENPAVSTEALHQYMSSGSAAIVDKGALKNLGFSVRCIKN